MMHCARSWFISRQRTTGLPYFGAYSAPQLRIISRHCTALHGIAHAKLPSCDVSQGTTQSTPNGLLDFVIIFYSPLVNPPHFNSFRFSLHQSSNFPVLPGLRLWSRPSSYRQSFPAPCPHHIYPLATVSPFCSLSSLACYSQPFLQPVLTHLLQSALSAACPHPLATVSPFCSLSSPACYSQPFLQPVLTHLLQSALSAACPHPLNALSP